MAFQININDIFNIVPIFNGSPAELNKFIACGNILFSSCKKEEHTTFLEIVKTRLQGPAFELIQFNSFTKWSDLVEKLEEEYKETKTRTVAQNELLLARQTNKESVKEFGDRISQLLTSLNSATFASTSDVSVRTYLVDENEKLAIQTFEDGLLNQSLRLMVQAHGETNLKKSINFAENHAARIDRQIPSFRNRPPPPQQNSSSSFSSRPTCQICGIPGHTAQTCYRNKSLPTITPKREEVVKCNYCNKNYHTESECRLRRIHSQTNQINPQNPFRQNLFTGTQSNDRNKNAEKRQVNFHHVMPESHFSVNGTGNENCRDDQTGYPSRQHIQAEIHQIQE